MPLPRPMMPRNPLRNAMQRQLRRPGVPVRSPQTAAPSIKPSSPPMAQDRPALSAAPQFAQGERLPVAQGGPQRAPEQILQMPQQPTIQQGGPQGPPQEAKLDMGPPALGGRTAYDLRRDRVRADAAADEERRREAMMRQLAGQGITDSGILGARQRTFDVDSRSALARALGDVDIEELGAQERQGQEQAQRDFLASQAELNRRAASGSQESSQRFQGEQNALNRLSADSLARLGYENQRGIMEFQDQLRRGGIPDQIKLLYMTERVGALDPKDPLYEQKLWDIFNQFGATGLGERPGGPGSGSNDESNPPNGKWTITAPSPGGIGRGFPGMEVTYYWNPQTRRYEVNENPAYAANYG